MQRADGEAFAVAEQAVELGAVGAEFRLDVEIFLTSPARRPHGRRSPGARPPAFR
jgi:hypothetical protein